MKSATKNKGHQKTDRHQLFVAELCVNNDLYTNKFYYFCRQFFIGQPTTINWGKKHTFE